MQSMRLVTCHVLHDPCCMGGMRALVCGRTGLRGFPGPTGGVSLVKCSPACEGGH